MYQVSPLGESQEGSLMRRADSLISTVIRELGIENGLRLAEIKKNWHVLFGEPLSCHMSPCMLSEGEILLNVDSPVWLQELNFYKEDILRKITSYGVRSVRFKLGRVSPKEKSKVKSQKSKVKLLTPEELSYIRETVSQIGDEALREIVKRTIEKAITSNRTKVRS